MHWRKLGTRIGLAVAIAAIGGGWIRDRDAAAAQSNTTRMFDHAPTQHEIRRLVGELMHAQQPDTTGSNWRLLSRDVAVDLRYDQRIGLRGRLFVRIEGGWYPVSMESPQDLAGLVPAR
jgi:hypothetical protein